MGRRGPVFAVAGLAAACASSSSEYADAGANPDAAPPDAAAADAAPPDAAGVRRLSETGLYEDIGAKLIDPRAMEFAPAYELWSDGAAKRRWLMLPEGGIIDTSDMDRWRFPAGTRVFKEFRVGEVLVETRLIEKTGEGESWMGAFLWEQDGSDAVFVESGARDAHDTGHDVPTVFDCQDCHDGEPGRILGFSAIQLSYDRGGDALNLASIAEAGLLSDPPDEGGMYEAPGEGAAAAALGYLHANCGNCHNPLGRAWLDGEVDLRLYVEESSPADPANTAIHASTVDAPLEQFSRAGYEVRVAPGDPDASALYYRMSVTSNAGRDRMPPLASDDIDPEGLAAVKAWIESLDPVDDPDGEPDDEPVDEPDGEPEAD